MIEKNTGGPAFPSSNNVRFGDCISSGYEGMTLRDYFAAKAMQALIAHGAEIHIQTEKGILIVPAREGIPSIAYEYADAMLKARDA